MSASRLTFALESGALVLPEGRVAVFRPVAGYDLSLLGAERVHVFQGFRPDFDHFATMSYDVATTPEGAYAAALVCLPRARAQARALVAAARAVTDGPVLIDGQKTDGIEAMLKDCRKRAEVGEVTSKAHGKCFAVTGGDFSDWEADPAGQRIAGGFVTRPGVFSADGVDPASALLAQALPETLPKTIADLGAGWGFLSDAILKCKGVETLQVVEAEHDALLCAQDNITDPRAQFHWADATTFRPESPLDAVITNPPFHTTRVADPQLGQNFIAAAAGMLKPSGKLWLVANRHLPYETEARALFTEVQEIAGDTRFKILLAAKPRRRGR